MTQRIPARPPELTRAQMDEQVLDYLYGELEPAAKAAFEQALPAYPDIAAELERHRWTREKMAELPVVPLPAGALDASLAAAEAHVASVAPKPSFFARLGALLRQPAFAMAMVAVLGVGVGLIMSRRTDAPGSAVGAGEELRSLPTPAPEPTQRATVPAVEVERYRLNEPSGSRVAAADQPALTGSQEMEAKKGEAPPKTELAAARGDGESAESAVEGVGPNGTGPGRVGSALEPAPPADPGAPPDVTVPAPMRPKTLEAQGFAASGDPPASPVVKGVAAEPMLGRETEEDSLKKVDALDGAWAEGNEDGSKEARATTLGGVVVKRPGDSEPVAGATNVGPAAPLKEVAADERPAPAESVDIALQWGRSKDAGGTVTIDDEDKSKSSLPSKLTTPTEKPADRPAVSAPAATNATPAQPRVNEAKPAAEKAPPPAPTEAQLWTTYQQQLAAGALADAQKTLADLLKMTGETTKLKNARDDLARRSTEALKAENSRNAPTKPMPEPNAPVPGRNQ